MPEAIQVLLSALVGAAAGAFATAYKSRKELESLYDIELRRRRIDTYAELWKLLEPLAYWSAPQPLTYARLAPLSKALRSWYFGSGGLFLSQKTRAPYFNLQESLTRLSDKALGDAELEPDTREIVKALASRLRTATTENVATRVEPRLRRSFLSWPGAAAPLRIVVDRRWDFEPAPPRPVFYVIVGNTGRREVEVERIAVEGVGELAGFLIQPAEEREVKAPIERDGPRPGQIPRVTVTLAGGRQVSSSETPDVPLRTPVLERFAP
jgi:hypothetical protein